MSDGIKDRWSVETLLFISEEHPEATKRWIVHEKLENVRFSLTFLFRRTGIMINVWIMKPFHRERLDSPTPQGSNFILDGAAVLSHVWIPYLFHTYYECLTLNHISIYYFFCVLWMLWVDGLRRSSPSLKGLFGWFQVRIFVSCGRGWLKVLRLKWIILVKAYGHITTCRSYITAWAAVTRVTQAYTADIK